LPAVLPDTLPATLWVPAWPSWCGARMHACMNICMYFCPFSRPQAVRRAYYATITNVDAQFQRLLSGLQDLGVDNSTVVVFSADRKLGLVGWRRVFPAILALRNKQPLL